MAKPLLPDDLWERIGPLLPPSKPRRLRFPGRKPIDNRKAMTGILFVLKSGIPWEDLPQEMGCGSGMTCWRRLREWHRAGVWQNIQKILLAELRGADRMDWSRAEVDSGSVQALGGSEVGDGSEETAPNPTDRAQLARKHHVVAASGQFPLVSILPEAREVEVPSPESMVEAHSTAGRLRGRPPGWVR